jgi:predicted CXXCH cytochrome family protein
MLMRLPYISAARRSPGRLRESGVHRRRAAQRMMALSTTAVVGAIVAAACSRETKHRILVFFYDGVPPLDAEIPPLETETPEASAAANAHERVQAAKTFFALPPYWENRCGSCHDVSNGRLVKTAREGLCQICHPENPPKTKYTHGPMAVNGCLACHHYHKSMHPKVLITDAQTLCFYCHENRELRTDEHHATIEQERCVDCHDPHGGDDRFFLRPRAAHLALRETR